MGQILHTRTTTTEATQRAIKNSEESLRTPAKRHGINIKTAAKRRKRTSVAGFPTRPKQLRFTVLSIGEEAAIVAFRQHTLLMPDDCLYALPSTIPHLPRSSLHRCLQCHGISPLLKLQEHKPSGTSRIIPSVTSTLISHRYKPPKAA